MRRSAAVLRPAAPDDAGFLRSLHRVTRAPAFAAAGMSPGAAGALLSHQFEIQARAYAQAYPRAEQSVILIDGQRAGRLTVERRDDAIHLVDIALLPEFRGRGVGTSLLMEMVAEADVSGRAITLEVAADSPALRLYRRLGFTVAAESGAYVSLVRRSALS